MRLIELLAFCLGRCSLRPDAGRHNGADRGTPPVRAGNLEAMTALLACRHRS